MSTWAIIAIVLVSIIGIFLLGLYLILRALGNKIGKVPEQIVKETFSLIKEKNKSKKNETSI